MMNTNAEASLTDLGLARRADAETGAAPMTRSRDATAVPTLTDTESDWPEPPTPEAYHGLAGDIVRAIEPHTEADPVALLGHVLVCYGSLIGRSAHYVVEDTEHHGNEFVVLIGRSSKGRKGTSEARIRRLVRTLDPDWDLSRVVSGLSSGEGLIEAVRDPSEKRDQDGEPIDHGVSDKRLLVIESEYASALRVLERQGNRLSPLIRQAWDSGNLQTLTKNPIRATNAHVSLIGHVVAEELRRYLTRTEMGNGYANRFLYLCVKRARLLPRGGGAPDVGPLLRRLHDAVEHGRRMGAIDMNTAAQTAWERVYPELSRERDGLAGHVTSRAEAHVVRLALLYALLDCAAEIDTPHLEAALALWGFAERSATYIWGETVGDPIADEIIRALRERRSSGMTRTNIRDLLGRHQAGADVDGALDQLQRRGLARPEDVKTGGRPAERWFATT